MPIGLIERTTTTGRRGTTSWPPAAPPPVGSRRSRAATWWPILIAAAVSVSVVTVAERFEPTAPAPVDLPSTRDDSPAGASMTQPADITATPAVGAVTATVPRSAAAPLGPSASTVAALAVDGIDLRLAAGTATLEAGNGQPIELTTTRIGDLVVADTLGPIVEQRVGEAAHVWPDVTEWYRELESGFEHGYTIDRRVHAGETLTIDVAIAGAEAIDVEDDVMFGRDSAAPLWYRGLHVFDADGVTLPATMSATTLGLTIEIATAAATYPITVDPVITDAQTIASPSPASGDRFGEAIDVDGDRMAVGMPSDDEGQTDAGSVVVFTRASEGDAWGSPVVITPPSPEAGGRFGDAVALSGDLLAVGESDRLGDDAESGRVFVYQFAGGLWSEVTGSPFAAPTPAAGDRFGASLAWMDADRLWVGAPQADPGGRVFQITLSGPTVTDLTPTAGLAPVSGDEFGFALAIGPRPDPGIGGWWAAVGAPGFDGGSGALYRIELDAGGVAVGTTRGSGYPAASRTGTAVAISGNRIIVGSIGDQQDGTTLRVGGLEWVPDPDGAGTEEAFWGDVGGFDTTLAAAITGEPNDYLDIEGGTVVVARPDLNEVGIYRYDGRRLGPGPTDQWIPAGSVAGDGLGSSVALDGRTVVAGAPDASTAAGTAYSAPVDQPAASYVGPDFGAWDDPANWDLGFVPLFDQQAIVPLERFVTVDDARAIDHLVVLGEVHVVGPSGELDVTSALDVVDLAGDLPATVDGEILWVQSGGLLRLPAQNRIDGQLIVRAQLVVDGATSLSGDGLVLSDGEIVKQGADTLTVGSGLTWTSSATSVLRAAQGAIQFQGPYDFQGTTSIEAGAEVRFASPLGFVGSSTLEVDVVGESSSSANYGRIVLPPGVAGTLDGALRANFDGYDPSASDSYPIISGCGLQCNDIGGAFTTFETDCGSGVLDLVRVPSTALALQVVENKVVSNAPLGSGFGSAVDMAGDLAIVGEPAMEAAHLLRRDVVTGRWDVIRSIDVEEPGFGRSVALDGTFVAIASDDSVFTYEIPPDPATEAFDTTGTFGTAGPASVDLLDGRVAMASMSSTPAGELQAWRLYADGTPGVTGPSPDPGLNGGNPAETIDPAAIGSAQFGTSVAIGGAAAGAAFIVVGAPGADGAVYVLSQSAGVWADSFIELTIPGGASNEFGRSVAASFSTVVVGDPLDDFADPDAGAAWVYSTTSDATPDRLVASDADNGNQFGSDVAIDVEVLLVGSLAGSLTGMPYRDGTAYVFTNSGATWSESGVLRADDGFNGETFGAGVALSGDHLLVGAPADTNNNGQAAGAVYSAEVAQPIEPPGLTFDLGVAGSTTEVQVAPTGIAVNRFNRSLVESQNATTVAASSISTIDLEATSLRAVPIGATPLSAIVLDSEQLSSIPLVQIDVDGGWNAIIDGTALEGEPFSTLTFRDVLRDPQVSQTVAALPLSAIDVRGTPLSAIPLSAIALGPTPLSAIPLSAIDTGDDQSPWCDIVADLIPSGSSCAEALAGLNLMEVTLRGVPLSAIPLSAIPLSAIDLSAAPLSAIPLSAIDLQASPLSAIPLSAIPLSAIGTSATPLSAIPLSAIPLSAIPLSAIPLSAIGVEGTPLSAIPLSAIPLSAIPTSIPLSAIPLSAIEVDGTPLSAIQVQGAPLSAIPLSAILLADTPLSAIPLSAIGGTTDWCAVLAGTGYDCTNGVDPQETTLRELSVRGVPLSAIPLSAIPLSAIPLSAIGPAAAPLSAIPLSAIPLSAIPLSAIPLSAIEVQGAPLSAIPLSAIDIAGSPLSAIPLSAIPLSAIGPTAAPLSAIPLSAIPLSAIPLSAIPLSAITVEGVELAATSLSAIDVLATPLSAIPLSAIPLSAIPLSAIDCSRVDCAAATLGDSIRRNAVNLAEIDLSDIQSATSGIRLGDLADAFASFDRAALRAAVDGSGQDLDDLNGVDDLTLGDLPADLPVFAEATLEQLLAALSTVSFADLVAALDDPTAGDAIRQAINGRAESLGDLDSLGDVTLGDLMADGGPALDLADIAPILGFITVQSILTAMNASVGQITGTLGDLDADELGQLTLADLVDSAAYQQIPLGDLLEELGLAGLLDGFTLADLLIALIDPASQAFGGFQFERVDVAALPSGTVGSVAFEAEFTLSGSLPRTIEVSVTLPSTAAYVRGSSTITVAATVSPVGDPVISGRALTWTLPAQPGQSYTIDFEVLPAVRLGATSLAATATVVGTDVVVAGSASVQVVEGLEPNDYPPTTPASDDTIYLTYISTPSDIDVFDLTLQENDRLLVEFSNLDDDLDLALYAKYDDDTTGASLSRVGDQPPLIPITDPDADGADTEPLDDFPRLDLLYPDDGLELLQVSNRSGTANETLSTGRLPKGTYYIQVHGVNGAVNVSPASLQLKVIEAENRPECVALGALSSATPGAAPALGGLTGNTLFLVNEMRLEQLYDASGRADVMDSLDELVAYLEQNPELGVDPLVVPVDGFADVRAAYAAWDDPVNTADACDPGSANAVVDAINSTVVDPLRDQLDHVVIVGGDDVIPMARLIDRTAVANEYDFRHEFDGRLAGNPTGVNAFTAGFWAGHFLSDEPYGEAAARSLGDRHLYVTDVALGRLVESPSEIAGALDTFVGFAGRLDVSTATVLGYDFLSDGSRDIADTLASGLGVSNVDDELAEGTDATGAPWDRADAEGKLEDAATNALVSLNAHFDYYRALPALGDKVPNFDDNLVAADVRTLLGDNALAQSLVFSMGCHSGLSVSDVVIGTTDADWAQTMGQLSALYVGNTGFGYGDTVRVAYTEELMAMFADEVVRPLDLDGSGAATTVGQALAYAKNRYIAENSAFSVYDEKAIMESTFYGLPFYRVGLAPVDPPAVPTNVTTPDVTDTPSIRTSVTATNTPVSTDRGTYYANVVDGSEKAIVAPGRPIQPKLTTDVSVVDLADTSRLAELATGVIVLGMESRWEPLADPVIAAPVFDQAAGAPEPTDTDGVFPARPVTINTVTEPGGERQRLALATGQYRSDQAVQRLDDRLDLVVYYRDPDETDVSPPVIGLVDSTLSEGLLTVQVMATDIASAIDRVYVLVAENPGSASVAWRGLDLTLVGDRWVGSLALAAGTTDAEFIVQAKDAVGNVGYATNKARNFLTSVTPPPTPPPASALSAAVTSTPSGSGWFDGPVTVSVTSSTPATYSIDGDTPTPVPTDGSFVIAGDGIKTWTVTSATGWSTSGTVRIDTAEPTITVGSPRDGATYLVGRGVVDVTCSDLSLATCTILLDGQPAHVGDSLPTAPGLHRLQVTATDALDRSASVDWEFTIDVDDDAPVLGAATWPSTPQLVGTEVVVTAPFTDETMPDDAHTASVDWGDGTTSSLFVRRSSSGGDVIGRHTYTVNGVYPVEVTVTDAAGNTSTTFDDAQQPVPIGYVVVYDPGAGSVSGSGTFWVESDLYGPRGKGKGTDVHFGYDAYYEQSSTVPDGGLSMHRTSEFHFESTAYDYLVINDSIAVAEGAGKLNRQAGYRFRVQGADLGSASFFQVTIWDTVTNDVVYDNGVLFDDDSTKVLLGGIRIQA